MPVISVHGKRVIETGSVAIKNGATSVEINAGSLHLTVAFPQNGNPAAVARAAGNSQITVEMGQQNTESRQVWNGTVAAGGNSYDVTIVSSSILEGGLTVFQFTYTITV